MQKFCLLIIITTLLLSCENPTGSDNTDISVSYTVNYDSRSATINATPTSNVVTSPATTVVTLPSPPTKTGYTFGGWFTGTNGNGTSFLANSAVTSNITVYAKWTANSYTVSYNSQSATVAASPTSKVVTFPVTTVGTLSTPPTKVEFVFEGWYTATNGGGTEFTSTTTVNGNITVYAYWTPKLYNVGDVGPAGGVVFYDKGFFSGGWRYLEAAPTDRNNHTSINSGNGTVWGSVFIDVVGANDTGLGDGESNTSAIITETGLAMNYAAKYADEYALNGYIDWFLPSKDELNLMYTLRNTIGNFFSYLYWSASQDPLDKRYAWHQNFSNGAQSTNLMKDNWNTKVRYIRAF